MSLLSKQPSVNLPTREALESAGFEKHELLLNQWVKQVGDVYVSVSYDEFFDIWAYTYKLIQKNFVPTSSWEFQDIWDLREKIIFRLKVDILQ